MGTLVLYNSVFGVFVRLFYSFISAKCRTLDVSASPPLTALSAGLWAEHPGNCTRGRGDSLKRWHSTTPLWVTTCHNDCAADGQRGAQGAEDRHVQELDGHSGHSLARGRQLGRGMRRAVVSNADISV